MQLEFLIMIMVGLAFVALGALFYSLAPTKIVCVCGEWFVLLGYSLELIPLMVKVAAVTRLIHKSRRMQRVMVQKSRLYQIVGGCVFLVMVYLATWTTLDPPSPQNEMTLTTDMVVSVRSDAVEEYHIVEVTNSCASSSTTWKVCTYIYLITLLIVMAAIATQNRGEILACDFLF